MNKFFSHKPRLTKILVIFFLFLTANSIAQLEFPEDKVKVKFSVEQDGEDAIIIATITVVPHWHINAVKLPEGSFGLATEFNLVKSPSFLLVGGTIEPKPIEKFDELADEKLAYHEGTIKMKRKIKITSEKDFDIKGSFTFQTCNEVRCLPDYTYNFTVKINGVEKKEAQKTEENFDNVSGSITKNKEGVSFVKVDKSWYEVPKGNSPEFYQKYLMLSKKKQ